MPAYSLRLDRRPRASITRRDLVPDLVIAAGAVAITAVVYLAILPLLGAKPPLVLFTAMAAALTSWRGFGPGLLASSLGTTVSSTLFIHPFQGLDGRSENVGIETLVMFTGSLFVCWLVYRGKADQENVTAVHDRRNDALAFVSHELRNPLSNVQLAAAMLERDGSDETRQRATRLIQVSATRLGKVIDDLIDVTRLDSNILRIDRKTLRLQDTILAAADAAGPAIAQRQQYFTVDVPVDPPLWVAGDDGRLQQVFANLLSNAYRYSPEGAEISISARQDNGHALVVVRDTGIGIRREVLERIFDPFVREAGGGVEGIGIGLTLVRNLVTQHGGQVTARSEGPGRGSTFVVELPLIEDHDARRSSRSNLD
ncbi:MAG TPA: ATP-binding protein [Vicinamibacterales bacterium]|jgi:signal transduction histidine kinase|nr:ATP-binding protein [Vicinamibacterales bacterium]